jgi:predicted molibdopterin-dependent oxidoreductase YjgC
MNDLRIKAHPRGSQVTLSVDGRPITAYVGETLFAALLAAGVRILGHSEVNGRNTGRGGFCGMGVCQECRVTVNGLPDQRACMTEVQDGMEVVTGAR